MVSLILFEIVAPLSAILLEMEIYLLSITSFGLYYQKNVVLFLFELPMFKTFWYLINGTGKRDTCD